MLKKKPEQKVLLWKKYGIIALYFFNGLKSLTAQRKFIYDNDFASGTIYTPNSQTESKTATAQRQAQSDQANQAHAIPKRGTSTMFGHDYGDHANSNVGFKEFLREINSEPQLTAASGSPSKGSSLMDYIDEVNGARNSTMNMLEQLITHPLDTAAAPFIGAYSVIRHPIDSFNRDVAGLTNTMEGFAAATPAKRVEFGLSLAGSGIYGGAFASGGGAAAGIFGRSNITYHRNVAASHIKQARTLLTQAGVPRQARNEIINSFEHETFRLVTTSKEMSVYRTFDDFDAGLRGRYVSENVLTNQTQRITKLALPGNSATRLGGVSIPKGSIVFEGKIAPQYDFSPAMVGGEKQLFLTGRLDNYTYKEILMPRNTLATPSLRR